MSSPKISIITVCYNASKLLIPTMRSVLGQSYSNIEYLLMDGASTDDSLSIIEEERRAFPGRDVRVYSEPDRGIYDAMNKGLHQATGDYVWFMNAGDRVVSSETLSLIFSPYGEGPYPDILYGGMELVDKDYQVLGPQVHKLPKRLDWKSFRMGMLVCHQAILVRRLIATDYDMQYSKAADIDWVICALRSASWVAHTHLVLAYFLEGGFSSKHQKSSWIERYDIMVKHYGYLQTWFFHFWIFCRHLWRKTYITSTTLTTSTISHETPRKNS